jgi:uncharacterized protein (TIGR02145 family)
MKTKFIKLAYAAGLVLAMTFIFPATSMAACTAANNTSTQYCSNGVLKQYDSTKTTDGKYYKTVVIGTQTWMAENLNYDRGGNGWSVCYKEELSYCKDYGRLYDWATAMNLPYDCNSIYSAKSAKCKISAKHQGICPCGWHIPTSAEWDKLYRYVDNVKSGKGKIISYSGTYDSPIAGKHLKSKNKWENSEGKSGNGEDTFGFSAIPGGGGFPANVNFYYVGYNGFWWSASENLNGGGGKHAYNQFMASNSDGAQGGVTYGDGVKTNLLSVRCVKD